MQGRWGQDVIPVRGVPVGGVWRGRLRRRGKDGGDSVCWAWVQVEEGEEEGGEVLPMV